MSAITVAVIPDRQSQLFSSVANAARSDPTAARSGLQTDVRRPTRGIVIKEDTYATLRVLLSDGTSLLLVNAGSRDGMMCDDNKMRSVSYSNFLIQQVQEERVEKQQIVETFGEAFIFFFGERPRILNFQGVLINTFDFNWEAEWWYNYDNYLRGTKCVENDSRVYITFDETMVSGYIMATNSTKSSQEKNYVPFSFQLFVTDYTDISRLGDPSANPDPNSEQGQTVLPSIFRPQLAQSYPTSPGGQLSLTEAYQQDALGVVQSTWSQISSITLSTLLSTNSTPDSGIRVPVGFAGALAFDDPKFTPADVVGLNAPIKFTTFGDNSDEFVGSSLQYGSAFMDVGLLAQQAFADGVSFNSQDEMFAEANKEWASYGLDVSSANLSGTVSSMSSAGIGLQVLTAARKGIASTGTVTDTSLSSGSAVVAGSTGSLSNAALADSNVSSSSETASAVDRAAFVAATTPSTVQSAQPLTSQPGVVTPTIVSADTPDPTFQDFAANLSSQSAQQRLDSLKLPSV